MEAALESDDSDSAGDMELEPEQGDGVEEDEKAEVQLDSEEEEERAAKEAQRELRNGLKNISFADNVEVSGEGEGAAKSVFAEVSFAAASRGII